MPIPENKKRVMLTLPKKFDYLIMKCKKYTYGESMTTSYLFIHLVLQELLRSGYLDNEAYYKASEEFYK